MNNREPVLFSNSTLGLFAVIALGALYWAFPGERLLSGLKAKPVDIASLAYVRAASNRDPNNPELRMQLVERLFEISNIPDAERALAPLLKTPNPSVKAQEISIKINFRHYFELTDPNQKQAAQHQLKSEIEALFPKLNLIQELDELADVAYQLGEPLTAAKIYRRIIEIQTQAQPEQKVENSLKWFGINSASAEMASHSVDYYVKKQLEALLAARAGAEALKWADFYVKQYNQDAEILRFAISIAQSQNDVVRARDWGRLLLVAKQSKQGKQAGFPCQKDKAAEQLRWECENKRLADQKNILKSVEFINFTKLLQSTHSSLEEQLQRELAANQLDNSLQWIQQLLKANPNAKETLQFAILLAQRKGMPDLARQWNAKLLEKNPNDLELIKKQIEFEMAVPDLARAFIYAQNWLKLAPEDAQAHAKVADIAQWSGQSEMTLKEWLWLQQHTKQSDFLPKIISLATSLYQYDALAAIFAQIGRERPLTEAEAQTWFTTLQKSGLEDAGSGYISEYLTRWPRQQSVWLFLIENLDSLDRTDESVTVLQNMEKYFPATIELRLKRVDYLIKLGHIKEAWQLLKASKTIAKSKDQVFWNKYADVAYLVGAEQDILTAYQKNILVGEDNSMLNYYFLRSLRGKEDDSDYEQYALKIWKETNDLSILLDLIDAKMQHGKWEDAKLLLGKVELRKHKAEKSPHYWLTQAEIAGHFDEKDAAQNALRKALVLEPDSASTRGLLIWHLVAAEDKTQLRKMLSESDSLAQTQAVLWESMAVGYRFLGEPNQALYWYAKALKQWPERQALVLEYAQLLQDSGRIADAKNLWRYLLTKWSVKDLVALRSSGNAADPAFERRYGEILRLYLGPDASQKWLDWIQQHQDKSTREFSEYKIAWFLAQQRFEQAEALAVKETQTGTKLPTWQQLAIAANANDIPAVKKIMQSPEQLTGLDKVNALRIMGEDQKALDLATQLLNTEQKEDVLESLRRFVTDLKQVYPNGWALSAKLNNVSELDILSYSAEAAFSKNQHGIWLNFRDQFFDSAKDTLRLQNNQTHEQLLNVEWKYRTQHYDTRLRAGANFREDNNFFTVESSFNYVLSPGWRVLIDGGYNVLSNDSAAFRVAGLTDKLDLRLSGEFSKREYFSIYGQAKQYKTRSGDSVGFGYGGGAEVGYRIWFEKPEWVIALYGNLKEANLDKNLPDEWKPLVRPGGTMSSVLNPSYKEIGIDLRLKEGNLNPFGFTGRSLRYFVEGGAFLGQPPGRIGTKITGGIGMRLFKDDELSLSGYYSSVQGGAQSIPSTSIELRYSKRFD